MDRRPSAPRLAIDSRRSSSETSRSVAEAGVGRSGARAAGVEPIDALEQLLERLVELVAELVHLAAELGLVGVEGRDGRGVRLRLGLGRLVAAPQRRVAARPSVRRRSAKPVAPP